MTIKYNPKFSGGVITSKHLHKLKNRSIYFNYNNKNHSMTLSYNNIKNNEKINLHLRKLSLQACNNIMTKIKQNYNKVNPNGLMMLLEVMNV